MSAVAWTFWPALKADFVNWDDPVGIVENTHIQGLDPARLKWMASTTFLGPYQPLSWLTLALDHEVAGLDPHAFHRTSLLLHIVSAIAVFLVAFRLYRVVPGLPQHGIGCIAAASLAAALFALHPLRCESVCWVTERRDVLSGPLAFLSLYFWLGWARPGVERGSRTMYGLALGAFALALLAKATTVAIPVFLVILDVWPLDRWRALGWKRALTEKLPFVALAGLISLVAIGGQQGADALLTLERHGIVSRAIVSTYAVAFYIGKSLVPVGLSPIYTLPPEPALRAAAYLVPAFIAVGLTVLAWLVRRRVPAVWWAWCAYLVALAPVAGVLQVGSQIAADRYTYIASLPLALLTAGGALWLVTRIPAARWPVVGVGLAAALALGIAARSQSHVWRDSEALWTHALSVDPQNPTANENPGDFLGKRGQAADDPQTALLFYQRASIHLEKAAALRPHPRRHYNAAMALWLLAELEPAKREEHLEAAERHLRAGEQLAERARIAVKPAQMLLHAHVQRARGELPDAIHRTDRAVRAVPSDVGARVFLGELLMEVRDPLAVDVLRGAEAMAPADGLVKWRLAQALAMTNDLAGARIKAEEAQVRLANSPAAAALLPEIEAFLATGGRR